MSTLNNLSETQRALLAKRIQQARENKTASPRIGRRPEGGPIPLSFAQRRLWFLSQWEPDSPAYNVPMVLLLEGWLNSGALERALNEIVCRHQVLRLRYDSIDGNPLLLPHPEPNLRLERIDLSRVEDRPTEMQRLAALEASRPFNLARDLPIRASLLRLSDAEYVLLLTMHHIATDAWSEGVLIKELAALYTAFCAGKPSPLPEMPIQYADFAYWQQNWLRGSVLEEQVGYWKKQLVGAPPVLELPADRPRSALPSAVGASFQFQSDLALGQRVKELSQRAGLTPFMTTLAAFQALLCRYSAQEDIVVGVPIANRNRSEIENLIGFFVNTLALRTDLSGNPTVRELLRRVREVTLEAYAHQDLPFERLVEELHPERSLSHSPIFQVMFNYHNEPHARLELPHLQIQSLDSQNGATKFDLQLALGDTEQGLSGTVTYSRELFNADTIQRFAERFQLLLAGMAEDPDRRLDELTLLSPTERRQILVEWCDTRSDYPSSSCLHRLFEEQVERTPEVPAVAFEGRHYSYRELNRRANQLAHYLQTRGVGPDTRVGLYMERSLDTLVGLLGILKAGGAYVPIDPLYPPERIRFMLRDLQVTAVVTEAALVGNLPKPGGVCLDRDWGKIEQESGENPPLQVALSNLMYVLFTSGSTGRPKGVAVEHRNYLNYYLGVMSRLKVVPGMHFAMVSTFSTDLGTIQFWAPLTTGGTTHLISYERATDPGRLVEYFRENEIDVLKLVPSHFDALQGTEGAEALVPRHLVIFTGEPSHWETVARVKALNPACMVQDHYGVTETTCATLVYEAPDKVPEEHGATLPLGRLLGNIRVYILDRHMEPAPVGIPGELYIGGYGVTRGYYNRPGLTAERFVPDPFGGEAGMRLYRTGDLAYYRQDGSIKLLGRIDHQVKVRGYRIETGEIESLLSEQPGVQDAVVVIREDRPGDRRLVAYLAPRPGKTPSLSALREKLREQLPDYMVPGAFVVMDKIPLNPNGKVDRFALPAPEYGRLEDEAFAAPESELEKHVASCWSEVLGVERIGLDDNFFDLGGESFKAIRAVRKIGEQVSVLDLFKHPTVRELARQLEEGQPRESGLLHELTKPVAAEERTFSLVCVPYGGGSAVVFRPLAEAMPRGSSLYALQIPGHDYSRREEALQSLEEVARQCAEEIRQVGGRVALYGHCVGGALAIEIARQLEASGFDVAGVFLGATFPSPRLPGKLFELMNRLFPSDRWSSNRVLYEGLRALGGFTDAVDPEERAFDLRGLRHDANEAEDYYTRAYAEKGQPKLKAPILCVIGKGDRATELYEERYREWDAFSPAAGLAVLPGAGHYFLKHQAVELAGVVNNQLGAWQDGQAPAPLAAPVPTVRPSLGRFSLVALTQMLSLIGTGLIAFALGVWVFQQTGSISTFALITILAFLPQIAVAPVAGALIDRWDRRQIMILADLLGIIGTALLVLLLRTSSLQIWHIYLVTGIGAIANAFQQPAYMAAVAQLVPKQYLGRANGIVQLTNGAGTLIAPLLGGALLGLVGLSNVIVIDVATCLLAVGVLLLIRFPNTLFRKREEPLWREIVGGWRYIIRRRSLVTMIGFFIALNLLFSAMPVLLTPMVLSFTNSTTLGTIVAINATGMLLGGLAMGVWGGTQRRADGMVGFCLLLGLSVCLVGLRPTPVLPAIAVFGIGVAISFINAHWMALIQAKVGLELQGRVLATLQMMEWSMVPLGYLLFSWLAERLFEPLLVPGGALAGSVGRLIGVGAGRGMGLLLTLVGLLLVVESAWGFFYRPLRYMEDDLPDAIPDAVIVEDKDALQTEADRRLLAGGGVQ